MMVFISSQIRKLKQLGIYNIMSTNYFSLLHYSNNMIASLELITVSIISIIESTKKWTFDQCNKLFELFLTAIWNHERIINNIIINMYMRLSGTAGYSSFYYHRYYHSYSLASILEPDLRVGWPWMEPLIINFCACACHSDYCKIFLYDPKLFLTTDKQQINIICPSEQQTTLMCSTNHIFVEWNVSSLGQTEIRSVSSLDPNPTYAPITMNSADFSFSRVSSPRALPLVSTMTIMNVNSNLEGTMISCSGLNSLSESTIVLMTTVHIYDMDIGRLQIQILLA